MKQIAALAFFILAQNAFALDAIWSGITNVHFDDGHDAIQFDPQFTRPSIWDILFFRKVSSDEKAIDAALKKFGPTPTRAVFISHSHYDHAMDSALFALKTGAVVVGTESTANIARGAGVPEKQIHVVKPGDVLQFGAYKVRVLRAVHADHILNYQFMKGFIEAPLKQPATLWEYRMGGALDYYVEHPDAKILFHPSSQLVEDEDKFAGIDSVDALFLGIASRKSSEGIITKIVERVKAPLVVPMHFDDFMRPIDAEGALDAFFGRLGEFKSTFQRLSPNRTLHIPNPTEKIMIKRISQ